MNWGLGGRWREDKERPIWRESRVNSRQMKIEPEDKSPRGQM